MPQNRSILRTRLQDLSIGGLVLMLTVFQVYFFQQPTDPKRLTFSTSNHGAAISPAIVQKKGKIIPALAGIKPVRPTRPSPRTPRSNLVQGERVTSKNAKKDATTAAVVKTVPMLPVFLKPSPRPLLSDLVQGERVTSKNINWLLDFAIVGFPKCGTTTMMHYLRTKHTYVLQEEQCQMMSGGAQPAKLKSLVQKLYLEPNTASTKKNGKSLVGLKCPLSLYNSPVLHNHKRWFPETKLIIGVRHPILWFENFYNYRVNNLPDKTLPSPNELIGRTNNKYIFLDTDKGRFHYYLASLGKTTLSTPKERKLVFESEKDEASHHTVPIASQVFLYDLNQLSDTDPKRTQVFREDLRRFLGSKHALPPMIRIEPDMKYSKKTQDNVDARKINICDAEHVAVRKRLLHQGRMASRWIREYFLQSKDVFVSGQDFFERSLIEWESDPCPTRESIGRGR